MPVGEWKLARRASSKARKVEQGATGYARRVSTPTKLSIAKPFYEKVDE